MFCIKCGEKLKDDSEAGDKLVGKIVTKIFKGVYNEDS